MYTYSEIFLGIAEKMMWVSLLVGIVLFSRLLGKKVPQKYFYILWFTVFVRILCPLGIEGIFHILPDSFHSTIGAVVNIILKKSTRWIHYVQRNQIIFDAFLVTYVIVVFALMLYMVISLVAIRIKLRDAIRIEANVYRTDRVESSLVCGIFRPRIYVNPGLLGGELKYILAHEKCHVKRRDYLVKPIAFMICAIVWLNPLIWVAYVYMMRDMEMSCDERAMRDMTQEEQKNYSLLLVNTATKTKRQFWQTPALGGNGMKKRIKNTLQVKKMATVSMIWVVALMVVCGCGAVSSPNLEVKKIPYQEKMKPIKIDEELFGFPDANFGFEAGNCLQNIETGECYLVANRQKEKNGNWQEGEFNIVKYDGAKTENVSTKSFAIIEQANELGAYFANGYHAMGMDGKLYISLVKYDKLFSKDSDVDKRKLIQQDWYLFQVDLEKGTSKKVNTPKWNPITNDMGLRYIEVFRDGNLLVTDRTETGVTTGVYNVAEGTWIRKIENKNAISGIRAGEDFYYCIECEGGERDNMNVSLYSEQTGELINEIKIGAAFELDSMDVFVKYQNDMFYLVNYKSIFSAEKDADEFECLLDAQSSSTFCLGDSDYIPENILAFPEENKYNLLFREQDDSELFMCQYVKE